MTTTQAQQGKGQKRNIGIIGAGQAGLLLGFELLAKGYAVTIYSDRTAEQIFNSRLTATTYLFGRCHGYEKALGINFWDGQGEYAAGGARDFPDMEALLDELRGA